MGESLEPDQTRKYRWRTAPGYEVEIGSLLIT